MKNGIYQYKDTHYSQNHGEILLNVKETEKSIILELLKNDMCYSPAQIEMMFGKTNKVRINKEKTPHTIDKYFLNNDKDWFVIYPYRAGIPFKFEYMEVQK